MNKNIMKFKGTKGKWYLQNNTDAYTNIIRCDDGEAFQSLYIASTNQSSDAKKRYNALLMSKAPEMLEMLQNVVDWYHTDYDPDPLDIHLIEQLIKEATEL